MPPSELAAALPAPPSQQQQPERAPPPGSGNRYPIEGNAAGKLHIEPMAERPAGVQMPGSEALFFVPPQEVPAAGKT